MSSLDTEGNVERSEGPSVRETLVSTVGALRESPNVTSAVNAGIADRDREIRNRDRANPLDRYQLEAHQRDGRNSATRNAVHEVTRQAAQDASTPKPINGTMEVSVGPPPTWSTRDKAQVWDTLSEPAKLVVLQEHAAIKPHLQRYVEIDRELSPIRHLYQQHGLSDAQGMAKIARTISALHDPRTAVQAYHELGRELNILGYQPQQYQQQYAGDPVAQQPDYSPQEEQAVHQHLAQFSQGKPHFEAVRYTMGVLLATRGEKYTLRDGSFDLEKAYREACRIEGLSDNRSRHSVSPPSRSPAVRHDTSQHSGGGSVRNSIMSAVRQTRGG